MSEPVRFFKMQNRVWASISLVVFIAGLVLSFAFNTLAVWSDLEGMSFWGYPESTSFDPNMEIDGQLNNLECPILLNMTETGQVRVKIRNPKEFPIKPWIQVTTSKPGEQDNLMRHKEGLMIDPGESTTFSWQVDPVNAFQKRIIFVRIYLFQTKYHPPSATTHCGIMVRDLGQFTGKQIVYLVTGISLLGMFLGGLMWHYSRAYTESRANKITGILGWLFGVTAGNILANLVGWALLAGGLLILAVLSVIAILEALAMGRI